MRVFLQVYLLKTFETFPTPISHNTKKIKSTIKTRNRLIFSQGRERVHLEQMVYFEVNNKRTRMTPLTHEPLSCHWSLSTTP